MVTTLDGYHVGPNGEFDWPNVDEEFHDFSIRQMNDIDTLLFGRVTYEYMAAFWSSAEAMESDPVTAGRMNTFRNGNVLLCYTPEALVSGQRRTR
jgi:dihydrofolate reductase